MTIVRPARATDTAAIARIHIDMWRIAYADTLDAAFLRRLSYRRSQAQWDAIIARHSGVLAVADSTEDGIVGFASGGAERTRAFAVDGELMALYVLTSAQGCGVGRQLLRSVASQLRDNGRTGMLTWVLADNDARGFYARLGAKPALTAPIQLGDTAVERVAYVWDGWEVLLGSR